MYGTFLLLCKTLFASVHGAKIRHYPLPYRVENPKREESIS